MKEPRDKKTELGRAAELLVSDLLRASGEFVLPSGALSPEGLVPGGAPLLAGASSAIISPDLIVAARGQTRAVEVKGKTESTLRRKTGVRETGVETRHYDHYVAFERVTGIPLWLVFVHVDQDEVLTSSLADLRKVVEHRTDGVRGAYDVAGMSYFPCDAMTLIARWRSVRSAARLTLESRAAEPRAPKPIRVANRWLSHDQLNAIAFAVQQRGMRDAVDHALDTLRAKGANDTEIADSRRLIEQRIRETSPKNRGGVQRVGQAYPPRGWAAEGGEAAPRGDRVLQSGRVRTRRALGWRIDGQVRSTPAELELRCYASSPSDGVLVHVLGADRWIRPEDLAAVDEDGGKAIEHAATPREEREKSAPREIADPDAFADGLFGFDQDTLIVPDDKMLELVSAKSLTMLGDTLHPARGDTLPYALRRRVYHWIRTSDAGKAWAAGQRDRHERRDRERPADVARFARPVEVTPAPEPREPVVAPHVAGTASCFVCGAEHEASPRRPRCLACYRAGEPRHDPELRRRLVAIEYGDQLAEFDVDPELEAVADELERQIAERERLMLQGAE